MNADKHPIATDVPVNPPDFRIFTASNGACIRCAKPGCNGTRYQAFMSESAITLACDTCGTEQFVIANKLAE